MQSMIAAEAAIVDRIQDLPSDKLAAWYERESTYLADQAEALRRHSVMGKVIE
jgi:hypothetical protein